MTNTLPILGRLAVITIGAVAVGYSTGIGCNVAADLEKEYVQDGTGKPAVLELGNQSFKVSFSKLFIDTTYATQVIGGTKVTVIVYPKSTTNTGDPKITLSNVVFNNWNLKTAEKGYAGEDVSGEGTGITLGTV